MQLAAGLAAKIFGGGAAAATGAAAGGGISAMSILSGAASLGGILATIGAGKAQAAGYKDQAFRSKLEAQSEVAQGIQRRTGLKRELLRVIGENSVSAAAAGLDLGAGLAAENRDTASDLAGRELSIDRETQDARRAMLMAQAAGYRRMAKEAKRTAMFQAFGQGFNALAGMAERGY